MQYSVFESELSKEEIIKLKREVSNEIDKKEDSIRVYSLCKNCRKNIVTIGLDKGSFYEEKFIII